MKRKVLCFVLTLLAIAFFSLGCGGGGGGSSNPASSNIAGQARVSGVVVDSSNNPVPNASVKLVLTSNALVNSLTGNTNSNLRLAINGNQTEFQTTTNNIGEYIFTNVPYGEYTLSAVTADGGQFVTRLAVKSDEVVQPNMTIMPFGSISGVVTDSSDKAISGAVVYLDGTSYCSVTGENGEYTLNYVPVNSKFSLCAMAAGFNNSTSKPVEILASESLELNTGNAFDTVKIVLSPITNTKAAVLSCTIKGTGAAQSNLLVFAVNQNDGTTFVGKVDNSIAKLQITKIGTYNLFVASIGNESNNIGEITQKPVNDLSSTQEVELKIGMIANSNFASLNLTIKGSGDFTAHLYDSTGHENKMTVSGTGSFKNLVPGEYTLAVYSDTMLKVKTGITVNKGENSIEMEPVNVIPTFTANGGCATATLDFSSASPASSDSDNLNFSLLSINDSDITELFDDKMEKTTFKVTASKSEIKQTFSLDNLSCNDKHKDSINAIKFFITNDLDKNVFEKSFPLGNKSVEVATTLYKTFTFKNNNGNTIPQTNVIYFKTITLGTKVGYLVVTSDSAYVYDGISETPCLSHNFTFRGNSVTIKQGNVCYIDDAKLIVVQFLFNNSGSKDLVLLGCLFNADNENTTSKVIYAGHDNYPSDYDHIDNGDIISPNKLLMNEAQGEYNLISLSDDCIRNFKISDLSGLTNNPDNPLLSQPNSICYFGRITSNDYLVVVATSSTIINDNNDNFKIYYLAHEYDVEDPSNVICLAEGNLDPETYASIGGEKVIARIEMFGLRSFNSDEAERVLFEANLNCSSYYVYDVKNENNYPLSLTDCLDNPYAETKIFINNSTNVKETKYVYSNTVYSGTNIKSSYIPASFYEAWIERNSDGQYFILREKGTYKEQKIKINQVLNINGYLEGSIGYTSTNDGDKIHVLNADESGNIKVMVLNLFKGYY